MKAFKIGDQSVTAETACKAAEAEVARDFGDGPVPYTLRTVRHIAVDDSGKKRKIRVVRRVTVSYESSEE